MKRLFILMVIMAAAIATAAAQQGQPAPTLNPGAKQAAPAAPPPAPTDRRPMPSAKTQEEFNAYQEAATKTTTA